MALDLHKEITSGNLDELVSILLFESVPYVFGGDMVAFRGWKAQLSDKLEVDPHEVIFTGSACAGFSLSPHKNLRPFGPASDIDIAIISEHHFSTAWHFLRGVDIALDPLTPAQKTAVTQHRTRYIYWGCIATDRILPILPFATDWVPARSDMRAVAPTAGREINFRVYKDFRALRAYQLFGLRSLKTELLTTS